MVPYHMHAEEHGVNIALIHDNMIHMVWCNIIWFIIHFYATLFSISKSSKYLSRFLILIARAAAKKPAAKRPAAKKAARPAKKAVKKPAAKRPAAKKAARPAKKAVRKTTKGRKWDMMLWQILSSFQIFFLKKFL